MSNTFEKQVGDQLFTIETGKLAQQANGAVVVRQGDSMVLVTATDGEAAGRDRPSSR